MAGLEVVRSLPDGYSLFAAAMPISAAPALLANMPFNLISEFAPVIRLSASYNVLVVNPSVPANSVADLVALVNCGPFSKKTLEKSSRPLNDASEKSTVDRNVARRKYASPPNTVKVKNASRSNDASEKSARP